MILSQKDNLFTGMRVGTICSGEQGGKPYTVDILMFDELDTEKSKWNSKGRHTIFNIAKKKAGFWPRLLKDTIKDAMVKVQENS